MKEYNLIQIMKENNYEKGEKRIFISFLIDLFEEKINPVERREIILDAFKYFGIREIIFVYEDDCYKENNFPLIMLFRKFKCSSPIISFKVDWFKGRLVFEVE